MDISMGSYVVHNKVFPPPPPFPLQSPTHSMASPGYGSRSHQIGTRNQFKFQIINFVGPILNSVLLNSFSMAEFIRDTRLIIHFMNQYWLPRRR